MTFGLFGLKTPRITKFDDFGLPSLYPWHPGVSVPWYLGILVLGYLGILVWYLGYLGILVPMVVWWCGDAVRGEWFVVSGSMVMAGCPTRSTAERVGGFDELQCLQMNFSHCACEFQLALASFSKSFGLVSDKLDFTLKHLNSHMECRLPQV